MLKDRRWKMSIFTLVTAFVFQSHVLSCWKMHISAQLTESYPRKYGSWSCGKEKLSIPLEAHHKAQSSKMFLFFQQKIKRAVIFYLLANPGGTAYWSFRDRELSSNVWLVQVRRRKVVVHTFWGGPKPGCSDAIRIGTIKSHNFFCLRSYAGEISHPNSPNRQLSNNLSDVVVRRIKVAVHTILHLTPTEAWRSAVSTTSGVAEFRALYG